MKLKLIFILLILSATVFAGYNKNKVIPNIYAVCGETTNSYVICEDLAGESQGTDYVCITKQGSRCFIIQLSGTPYVFNCTNAFKISKTDQNFVWGPADEEFLDLFPCPGDGDRKRRIP